MAQVSRMIVILAANALLEEYLNPAVMEGLITGASLAFHVNGEPGSVIEGSGMNRENVASNEVLFIGGAAVAAVEGLIDAFNPSNIDSFDDIDDYFEGIVDALQGAGEAYDQAEQPPDSVVPGCIPRRRLEPELQRAGLQLGVRVGVVVLADSSASTSP